MPERPAAPPPPPPTASDQEWTAYLLDLQAPACAILGSALYADLLNRSAQDVRAGGPVWEVLQPHATRSTEVALALRFMAALHRLVLLRLAPQLALCYPSVGGTADPEAAWPAVRAACVQHRHTLREFVGMPCQTNEVGRSAALAPGFLVAAQDSGLPLRLLEIGASAGLNLRWDRYHYGHRDDGRGWGPADSPVQLVGHWDVPPALLGQTVHITTRAGCDPRPIDATTDEGRLSLTASVWADQPHRFERLRGALRVAAQVPVDLAQAPAGHWLPQRLDEPVGGSATVVYHSVVSQYMPPAEREEVSAAIRAAGERATTDASLFWLRMEPERPLRAMSVRLTSWPGGDERLLATAGAHGDPVRWTA
jgi:hypothetical protein